MVICVSRVEWCVPAFVVLAIVGAGVVGSDAAVNVSEVWGSVIPVYSPQALAEAQISAAEAIERKRETIFFMMNSDYKIWI